MDEVSEFLRSAIKGHGRTAHVVILPTSPVEAGNTYLISSGNQKDSAKSLPFGISLSLLAFPARIASMIG